MPEFILTTLIRFIKTSDQLVLDHSEVCFWVESNLKAFTNTINQPLAYLVDPVLGYSEDTVPLNFKNFQEIDSKANIKALLEDFGPLATHDEELFK